MARKRYISTELSTDGKLADLSSHGFLPLLLYTWSIPHMDDWGRITGDARQFKLLVCPALDVSLKEIDATLDLISSAGLWERYEVDGKRCIAVATNSWFKHQSYINKGKREDDTGSDFPGPDKRRRTPQNAEEHRETPQFTEEQQESPQIAEIRQGTAQIAASFSSSSSLSSSVSSSDTKDISSKREVVPYVFLTETELIKLTDLLGDDERDQYFIRYAAWISGQTKRVQEKRSAYLTILTWHREDQKKVTYMQNRQASSYQKTKSKLEQMLMDEEAKEREQGRNHQTNSYTVG